MNIIAIYAATYLGLGLLSATFAVAMVSVVPELDAPLPERITMILLVWPVFILLAVVNALWVTVKGKGK